MALLLLIIILVPLCLPFALLGAGPTVIIAYIRNKDFYWGLSTCEKFPIVVLSIILGLILNPIAWVGLIIYFLPVGIGMMIDYYRRMR